MASLQLGGSQSTFYSLLDSLAGEVWKSSKDLQSQALPNKAQQAASGGDALETACAEEAGLQSSPAGQLCRCAKQAVF